MQTEVVQGVTCKGCDTPLTIDQCVVLRENPTEGRVHISTCIYCIAQHNPELTVKL